MSNLMIKKDREKNTSELAQNGMKRCQELCDYFKAIDFEQIASHFSQLKIIFEQITELENKK